MAWRWLARGVSLGAMLLGAAIWLPGARGQDASADVAAGDLESRATIAREGLALRGVDDARLDEFVDGRDIAGDERESFARLVAAVTRFSLLETSRGRLPKESLGQFLAKPVAHRGQLLALTGRVTRVEVDDALAADEFARFELGPLHRCQMRLDAASDVLATVYALEIPKAWPRDEAIDEPAMCDAFFIKLAGDAERPRPVFVTRRMAWPNDTLLGRSGMDVGLFDQVRQIDVARLAAERGKPKAAPANITLDTRLSGDDRECFYQLLAACGRIDPSSLGKAAGANVAVAPLFNDPVAQRGRLVALEGMAREILLVNVADMDIVERLGIDHYYTIALFPDDSQSNPVYVCVRELPPGLSTGDRVDQRVRVPCFFMKTWGYTPRSAEFNSTETNPQRQLAPLLIGRTPEIAHAPARDMTGEITLSVAIAVGLTLLVACVVWGARSNRLAHKKLSERFAPVGTIGPDESRPAGGDTA